MGAQRRVTSLRISFRGRPTRKTGGLRWRFHFRHRDELSELAIGLGIWDGRHDQLSAEKILTPLQKIASDGRATDETNLLARTFEGLYFVKAGGDALRSYYNVGGCRAFRAIEEPKSAIDFLALETYGKILHSMAGIDNPSDEKLCDRYRVAAAAAHEKVPRDSKMSALAKLPFPIPVGGRLTEMSEADLTLVDGEPRSIYLADHVVRQHRYLMALYVTRAARLFVTKGERELINGQIALAVEEAEHWGLRGVASRYANLNIAYWSNAREALKVLTHRSEALEFEKSAEDDFLSHEWLPDISMPKRLLWTAGTYAVLVACGEDGAAKSLHLDLAIQNLTQLLSVTRGRAAMSLQTDAHFMLASFLNEDFRIEFERLLTEYAECPFTGLPMSSGKTLGVGHQDRHGKGFTSRSERNGRPSAAERLQTVLQMNRDRKTQDEIGERFGVDQSTVSRYLKKLKASGEYILKGRRRPGTLTMPNDVLDAGARTHKGVLAARSARKSSE